MAMHGQAGLHPSAPSAPGLGCVAHGPPLLQHAVVHAAPKVAAVATLPRAASSRARRVVLALPCAAPAARAAAGRIWVTPIWVTPLRLDDGCAYSVSPEHTIHLWVKVLKPWRQAKPLHNHTSQRRMGTRYRKLWKKQRANGRHVPLCLILPAAACQWIHRLAKRGASTAAAHLHAAPPALPPPCASPRPRPPPPHAPACAQPHMHTRTRACLRPATHSCSPTCPHAAASLRQCHTML